MFSFIFNVQFILTVLAVIGFYALVLWLIDNFGSIVTIVKTVLTPLFQPQDNLSLSERYGTWAVITGSTDGIGKEYAKELASRGINIVLISRTKSKLIEVANEIESVYPIKTKWIAADFSKGNEIFEHIKKELEGIQVGILVNNVGRNYDFPDDVGKISEQVLWDIININIGAATMMTRIIVNDMKKRRKGAIINVSSGSELQPLPYMAVYGASKAYIKNFTLAIRNEFAPHGITVQLITPMYVQTKMNAFSEKILKGNILIPDVKSYTKSAVFTLGKTHKTTGYWSHGIQYGAMKIVPEWARTIIGSTMNRQFRKEYYQNNNKSKLN